MSVSSRTVRFVHAKVMPVYVCDTCGNKQAGDPVDVDLPAGFYSPVDVHGALYACAVPNRNLPVGWSCAGENTHYCPPCTAGVQ